MTLFYFMKDVSAARCCIYNERIYHENKASEANKKNPHLCGKKL